MGIIPGCESGKILVKDPKEIEILRALCPQLPEDAGEYQMFVVSKNLVRLLPDGYEGSFDQLKIPAYSLTTDLENITKILNGVEIENRTTNLPGGF